MPDSMLSPQLEPIMARTDELKGLKKEMDHKDQIISDDLDGNESCSDDGWMQFPLTLNEEVEEGEIEEGEIEEGKVEEDMFGKSRPISRFRVPRSIGRFKGRVFLRSHDEALRFADKYSQRREADGILALFTDGSASEPRFVINKNTPAVSPVSPSSDKMDIDDDTTAKKKKKKSGPRWCSCSAVYRPKPNDLFWERRGFELPSHIEGNTDAELAGLTHALEIAHDVFANDAAVKTILIFCDSALLLRRLTTLATETNPHGTPNWNATYLHLLLDYADLLTTVYDKDVQLHWVPAHAGALGNEIADRTAHECRPDVRDPVAHPVVGAHERRLAAHNRDRHEPSSSSRRRRSPRLHRPSVLRLARLPKLRIPDSDPRLPESSRGCRRPTTDADDLRQYGTRRSSHGHHNHGAGPYSAGPRVTAGANASPVAITGHHHSRAGSYSGGSYSGAPHHVTGVNASPVATVHHHHDRTDSRSSAPHVTGANASPMLDLHRSRTSERRASKKAYRLGSALDHHGSRSGRHYWDRDRPV
ncbi:hypothetical protein UCDDS831_g07771 [Diplodia seriata]|uniref:RNase H type-1 domain-containing protein n=1 Tax=Diplodia seriata TaxID=420778 RepID=A0A0G2GDU4_9PEZI|nr:hypothetical protein UCDDS831_g07771 [Diplodia seriata]